METVFKVGDKVFDIRYGWGEVEYLTEAYVNVKFKDVERAYEYSGKNSGYQNVPMLSFTEYELKGFSQERPKEEEKFEKGQIVYVSSYKYPTSIICGKFIERTEDGFYEINNGCKYKYCWSKNPLIEEKEETITYKLQEKCKDLPVIDCTNIFNENKDFKYEIGKFYFMWSDLKEGYSYMKLLAIDNDFEYKYETKDISFKYISETNPLDK